MKKTITIAMAALVAFAACTQEEATTSTVAEKLETCEVTVGVTGSRQTRATGISADSEEKINSLQVFVFRGEELDAYASAENATRLTLSCTAGERMVYALANAPDLSSVSTLPELKGKVSVLSANHIGNFEMIGERTAQLPLAGDLEIDVRRIVSRVTIGKINRNFTSPAHQAMNFSVDRIYLVNVASDINYGLTSAPAGWYNLSENKGEASSLTADEVNAPIAEDASYDTSHLFYAYPNDASVLTTRLVIEATLGDNKYYYPVNLPAMSPNYTYDISEVTITRPGSDNPDIPVSFSEMTVSISVKAWDVVPVTEGTTI